MTRAEAAQIFYNLLLEPHIDITKTFPDEVSGVWHEQAVHTLATLGIIVGRTDGKFHPQSSITRAEFIAMAVRFAEALPEGLQGIPFNDVDTSHWAYRYIDAAFQFGWITGYGDGTFRPNQHISRAQVVTLVNRMLNRVADRDYIDGHTELSRFDDVPNNHWAYYDIMEAFDGHEYDRDPDGEHEHWHD
jgi:hypothetical protein